MTKERQAIKAAALTELAVCLECHRRFQAHDIKKHMTNSHKGLQVVKLQDQIIKYNSIKVLHGICQNEKFYINIQHFITSTLKLLCKTPN